MANKFLGEAGVDVLIEQIKSLMNLHKPYTLSHGTFFTQAGGVDFVDNPTTNPNDSRLNGNVLVSDFDGIGPSLSDMYDAYKLGNPINIDWVESMPPYDGENSQAYAKFFGQIFPIFETYPDEDNPNEMLVSFTANGYVFNPLTGYKPAVLTHITKLYHIDICMVHDISTPADEITVEEVTNKFA